MSGSERARSYMYIVYIYQKKGEEGATCNASFGGLICITKKKREEGGGEEKSRWSIFRDAWNIERIT